MSLHPCSQGLSSFLTQGRRFASPQACELSGVLVFRGVNTQGVNFQWDTPLWLIYKWFESLERSSSPHKHLLLGEPEYTFRLHTMYILRHGKCSTQTTSSTSPLNTSFAFLNLSAHHDWPKEKYNFHFWSSSQHM